MAIKIATILFIVRTFASMINEAEITKSVNILAAGKTLLYPTDTLWAVGCDACNEQAVQKIIALKNRPAAQKGFVILIADINALYRYINKVSASAINLIELSNSPLTVILDNAINLAPSALAADESAAIRLVKNPSFCHDLIRKFRKPLIASSANLSGQPAPSSFDQVEQEIVKKTDYTVNLPNERGTGKPSSIIRLAQNDIVDIVRK